MEDIYTATSHLSPLEGFKAPLRDTWCVSPVVTTWRTVARIPPGKTRRDGLSLLWGQSEGTWLQPMRSVYTPQVCLAKNVRVSPTDPTQAQGSSHVATPWTMAGRPATEARQPSTRKAGGGSSDSKAPRRAKCLLEASVEQGPAGGELGWRGWKSSKQVPMRESALNTAERVKLAHSSANPG